MDATLTEKAERLAREVAADAKTVDDLNGLVRLILKSALERMLDTEMDVHLGRRSLPGSAMDVPAHAVAKFDAESPAKKGAKNRRNGRSPKTVQGDLGEITLETPRDRNGTFEPQVIPKHQRRLAGFWLSMPRE
jgi:putative transposase